LGIGESILPVWMPEGRLYYAAAMGLTYAVRDIVTDGAVGVNAPVGYFGGSAANTAAHFGHARCLRELIRLGGSVRLRCARDGRGIATVTGVLCGACASLNVDALGVLLDAGADVNGRDEVEGMFRGTPLHVAVLFGFVGGVRLLLQQPGIDIRATSTFPRSMRAAVGPGAFSALDLAVRNPWRNPEEEMVAIRGMLIRAICGAPGGNAPAQEEGGEIDPDGRREALLGGLRRLRGEAERAQSASVPYTAPFLLAELRCEVRRVFSVYEGIAVGDLALEESDDDGQEGGGENVIAQPDRLVGEARPGDDGVVDLRLSNVELFLV
ncbi:MAG: hypothetical protein VXZ39_08305, partial [Planctomycetota bacterium]|nr:hypothetical protein [Planctomycetota bacterium]